MLDALGVIAVIDEAAGRAPAVHRHIPGAGNAEPAGRAVRAKAAFADWRKTTAADRFTKITGNSD
jgi:hypothetical protein